MNAVQQRWSAHQQGHNSWGGWEQPKDGPQRPSENLQALDCATLGAEVPEGLKAMALEAQQSAQEALAAKDPMEVYRFEQVCASVLQKIQESKAAAAEAQRRGHSAVGGYEGRFRFPGRMT